jgi:hypothetical protein
MAADELIINGEPISVAQYRRFHRKRIALTLSTLRQLGAKDIVELGGHPWVMTSSFVDEAGLILRATVSAEEVTNWPDDIGVNRRNYGLTTPGGATVTFPNYSANIERTLFDISEKPDTVIACEILEHLLRSPHIMLLNANRWLARGGKLLVTTPNGSQFSNPFRRKSGRPAYRCNVYARHNGLMTLAQVIDLVRLCGFEVRDAGFWNVYERSGMSRLYSALGAIPFPYLREKFQRTIFVAAEKIEDVTELSRLPKCYAPSRDWENIRRPDAAPAAGDGCDDQ